jgi:hypothetical protein
METLEEKLWFVIEKCHLQLKIVIIFEYEQHFLVIN